MSELGMPTQFEFTELTLNGENALQIFMNIEIFENIFLGGITGSISIFDTDSLQFIDRNGIEFIEEISFSFKNAYGDELKFKGLMNGLRNEIIGKQNKTYVIDFTSKAVRNNEMNFINRAFKNVKPEDVIQDMTKIITGGETEIDMGSAAQKGLPLTWVAGNRKPLDVIKYVVNHAVTDGKVDGGKEEKGQTSGTGGYLYWETMKGHRFCTMDSLVKDQPYEYHEDYGTRVQNITGQSLDHKMKAIVDYQFPKVGDLFEKLRSGAFSSTLTSFNLDTGIFTEFNFTADDTTATKKQQEAVKGVTRKLNRMFTNEKFEKECKRAQEDTGDQSRKYLQQTITGQNTFCDKEGRITLPPQFNMNAGDCIDVTIDKLKLSEEDSSEYQPKYSGKYLISQVGHHIFRDGNAYTKLSVIRTTTQQDDQSS